MGWQSFSDIIVQNSADKGLVLPLRGDMPNGGQTSVGGFTNASTTAYRAGWGRTVPTLQSGVASLIPTRVGLMSSLAQMHLVAKLVNLGDLNIGTNVFTAGSAMPTVTELGVSRVMDGTVLWEVTNSAGLNATPGTFSVTYTNQDGTTSQTSATITMGASVAQYRFGRLNLNGSDTGVRQITAASQSGGTTPSGTIRFWGIVPIAMLQTQSGPAAVLQDCVSHDFLFQPLTAGDVIGVIILPGNSVTTAAGMLGQIVTQAQTSGTPTAASSVLSSISSLIANAGAYGNLSRFMCQGVGTIAITPTDTNGQVYVHRMSNPYTIPAFGGGVSRAYCTYFKAACISNNQNQIIYLHNEFVLGTLTVSGNSYSAGVSMPTRTIDGSSLQTATQELYAVVTGAVTAATPNLTLTYTNQDGTGSRTTSGITLPSSPAANVAFRLNPYLQSGDTGVRSVQSASISTGSAGTIKIMGCIPVGRYLCRSSASAAAPSPIASSLPMVSIAAGDTLSLYNHIGSTGSLNSEIAAVFGLVGE